jgi:hypothetical protein
LAAVAGIVHPEDLWQLCRDNTGADVRTEGWAIRGRSFGVVVAATPRLGKLRRGETIPWHVSPLRSHRPTAAARADQMEPTPIGGRNSPVRRSPPRSWLWRLSRVQSIIGGTTEIMKEIIGRGLGLQL